MVKTVELTVQYTRLQARSFISHCATLELQRLLRGLISWVIISLRAAPIAAGIGCHKLTLYCSDKIDVVLACPGTVNGLLGSLASLFQTLSFAISLAFPSPEHFPSLMVLSATVVVIAAGLHTFHCVFYNVMFPPLETADIDLEEAADIDEEETRLMRDTS